MDDTFLQILLFFLGAILALVTALLRKPGILKVILGVLSIGLFALLITWIGYKFIDFGRLSNPQAESNGILWNATFYENKELKEPSNLETTIKGARNGLRVDWGVGAPRPGMPVDFFSAIFTTIHNFTAGLYCFTIEVDDGGRLFIDGSEVRNVWWGYTPGAVYKNKVVLDEGPHTIQFYYYEEYEKATFHLAWYNKGVGGECVTVGHPGVP